jgi:hypothetical protein
MGGSKSPVKNGWRDTRQAGSATSRAACQRAISAAGERVPPVVHGAEPNDPPRSVSGGRAEGPDPGAVGLLRAAILGSEAVDSTSGGPASAIAGCAGALTGDVPGRPVARGRARAPGPASPSSVRSRQGGEARRRDLRVPVQAAGSWRASGARAHGGESWRLPEQQHAEVEVEGWKKLSSRMKASSIRIQPTSRMPARIDASPVRW